MTVPRFARNLLLINITLCFAYQTFGQSKIILEGHYEGKNLFIENPRTGIEGNISVEDRRSFPKDHWEKCIDSIWVNDQFCKANVTHDAFAIELESLGFHIGDSIKIIIFHKDNCKPKILNPGHGRKSPFDILEMAIDEENVLRWVIKKFSPDEELVFHVEQFRWNKWVKVGETGPDTVGGAFYSFALTTLHSGENKVRVKHIDSSNRPRYSSSVNVLNDKPAPKFGKNHSVKYFTFSEATLFELYNAKGDIIKKGFDSVIEIHNLEAGTYYLNYDKAMTKFIIRASGVIKTPKKDQ